MHAIVALRKFEKYEICLFDRNKLAWIQELACLISKQRALNNLMALLAMHAQKKATARLFMTTTRKQMTPTKTADG